jgi:predicted phosphate transport protein (TIGR00153 family)
MVMGFKEWIIPQEKVFFQLFNKQSKNVLAGAELLLDIIKDFDAKTIEKKKDRLKGMESAGDGIVHEVYEKLNNSFITPIDHEDITRLVSTYDDVIDLIYTVANRMWLFRVRPTPVMEDFAVLIRKCVSEIDSAVAHIEKLNQREIDKRCIEIHTLENHGDDLLDESLEKLFRGKDTVSMLKLKEIYEFMETVTDRCEDVAFALNDIVIKHK